MKRKVFHLKFSKDQLRTFKKVKKENNNVGSLCNLFVRSICLSYGNANSIETKQGRWKCRPASHLFERIKVPGRKFLPSKNLRSNDPYVEIAHRVASDGAIRSAIQCHPLFVGRANNQQPCGTRFIPQTRRPFTLKGCVCLIFREILFFTCGCAFLRVL